MDATITMALDDIELRIAPWRAGSAMALITPIRFTHRVDREAIDSAVRAARENGYHGAYTSALNRPEAEAFSDAGFTLERELHLLVLDIVGWQRRDHHFADRTGIIRRLPHLRQTRVARSNEYSELLEIDRAAFDDFWRFDQAAMRDAITATPMARVAVNTGRGTSGYHITGRSGEHGYIQRLAVRPQRQSDGVGRTLLVDALAWLQRHRVRVAHVNTQLDNERALGLYESEGFVNQPDRLSVFVLHFGDKVRDTTATGR